MNRKTKICRGCSKRKTIERDFYFANKARTVYAVECKHCSSRRTVAYRKANPEARLAADRKWKYGITKTATESLLKKQKGLCAICKIRLPTHLDHDHKTNEVRGLLCGGCNKGLGNFGDDIEKLKAAVRYLKNHVKNCMC